MPSTETSSKYVCCECGEDVTATVEAAIEEERKVYSFIPKKTAQATITVMVQCSKGHWCKYTCKAGA